MYLLFKILFFASLVSSALAGKERGNGGDVIYCENDNGDFSYEVLDLYESRVSSRGFNVYFPEGEDVVEKTQKVFDQLKTRDIGLFSLYSKILSSFFENTAFVRENLVDIPDSGHLFIPDGCSIRQAAVNRIVKFDNEKTFIFDEKIWEKLSEADKIALVVHEIVYHAAAEMGHQNSIISRYLVSWLLSKEFSEVSKEEFHRFILKQGLKSPGKPLPGKLKYETLKKYSVVSSYDDGTVEEIRFNYGYIRLNGNKVFIKDYAHFYPDGTIKQSVVDSGGVMELNDGREVRVKGRALFNEQGKVYSSEILDRICVEIKNANSKVCGVYELMLYKDTLKVRRFSGEAGVLLLPVQSITTGRTYDLRRDGTLERATLIGTQSLNVNKRLKGYFGASTVFSREGYVRKSFLMKNQYFKSADNKSIYVKKRACSYYLSNFEVEFNDNGSLTTFCPPYSYTKNVLGQAFTPGRYSRKYQVMLHKDGKLKKIYVPYKKALSFKIHGNSNLKARLFEVITLEEDGITALQGDFVNATRVYINELNPSVKIMNFNFTSEDKSYLGEKYIKSYSIAVGEVFKIQNTEIVNNQVDKGGVPIYELKDSKSKYAYIMHSPWKTFEIHVDGRVFSVNDVNYIREDGTPSYLSLKSRINVVFRGKEVEVREGTHFNSNLDVIYSKLHKNESFPDSEMGLIYLKALTVIFPQTGSYRRF